MYEGGCLCGQVRFVVTGPIESIVHCHCSRCRKSQGSSFATNGVVDVSDFELLSGSELLTAYEATPGQKKYFCKVCGSPIMSKSEQTPEQIRLRIGTIESDIKERPTAHIFITSRANWDEITGDLPQYESYEPGRDLS